MSATMFEPMLSKATIKAIDSVARKLGKAQRGAGNAVTRLFDHWNEMSDEEKQHVAGIMIATAWNFFANSKWTWNSDTTE